MTNITGDPPMCPECNGIGYHYFGCSLSYYMQTRWATNYPSIEISIAERLDKLEEKVDEILREINRMK